MRVLVACGLYLACLFPADAEAMPGRAIRTHQTDRHTTGILREVEAYQRRDFGRFVAEHGDQIHIPGGSTLRAAYDKDIAPIIGGPEERGHSDKLLDHVVKKGVFLRQRSAPSRGAHEKQALVPEVEREPLPQFVREWANSLLVRPNAWETLMDPTQHRWSINLVRIASDVAQLKLKPHERADLANLTANYLTEHLRRDDPYALVDQIIRYPDSSEFAEAGRLFEVLEAQPSLAAGLSERLDLWRRRVPFSTLSALRANTLYRNAETWTYGRHSGSGKEQLEAAIREDDYEALSKLPFFKDRGHGILDGEYDELMAYRGILTVAYMLEREGVRRIQGPAKKALLALPLGLGE